MDIFDQIPQDFLTQIAAYDADYIRQTYENNVPSQVQHLFLMGVGFLYSFLQQNFTGPALVDHSTSKLHDHPELRERLEVDGEPVLRHIEAVDWLYYARLCLIDHQEVHEQHGIAYNHWWAARCLFVHQQVLSEPSMTLKTQAFHHYARVEAQLKTQNDLSKEIQLLIEQGLFHHLLSESREALAVFLTAQEKMQLTVKLTGILGVRTRFQTFKTALLTLDIQSNQNALNPIAESSQPTLDLDDNNNVNNVNNRTIQLNDDTLLEKPKLDHVDPVQPVGVMEQILLLALCLNVKNRNPAHGLTKEEMMAYVNRVSEHPNNWLVHSTCLFIRSMLEVDASRTVERAALQMHSLVEQYHDASPGPAERLKHVFTLAYPNYVVLQKELGHMELSLGIAASALTVFQRLEMWEQVVMCYRIMGKLRRAEKVLREQLSVDPTPELWVMLGDLTSDEGCFERAWELSEQRYARAQRFWGRHLLKLQKWKEAIYHFQLALKINPLFPDIWFSLGCSALQIGEWQTARDALSRMVSMHPDDGEAWNNLANCYVQLKEPRQAFHCYEQALKHKRESWKIWQNFLYVALQLGQFRYAIDAIHEMIELKAAKEVPIKLLRHILAQIQEPESLPTSSSSLESQLLSSQPSSSSLESQPLSSSSQPSSSSSPASSEDKEGSLSLKFKELLGHFRQNVDACSADIWRLHYEYYVKRDLNEALEYLNRENRSRQATDWKSQLVLFQQLVDCQSHLIQLHMKLGDPKHIYSATLQLKRLIKQSEDIYFETSEFQMIQNLLANLSST